MEINPKKGNSKREPRSESRDEEESTLIPSHIIDQASQRVFLVSLFILIQSWKLYEVLLLRSGVETSALTSLNNFTFVLKYAIIDGAFFWILPVLNVSYLTFSPFQTLLATLTLNGITLLLVSSISVPFISTFLLPLLKAVVNNKELTILGDSVASNQMIDIESHFKGRYTIHYVPDSSAKFNPFHFENICLESSSSTLQMPIEFNTTTQLGLLQIEHTSPLNQVKLFNYTQNDISKLLRKDYSHLSQYSDYIKSDKRIFYLEIPISSAGKYRISKVMDKSGLSIRSYKSEFYISSCPSASFVYAPNFNLDNNFKCLDEDNLNLQLPLVSLFGVSPFEIKFRASIDGKNFTSFNSQVVVENSSEMSDLSWLLTHSITRNVLEQELLQNPKIITESNAGVLAFQLMQVKDGMGNVRRYNPSSTDKDVYYQLELKPALEVQFDTENIPLLINSSKTLNFHVAREFKDSDFPLQIELSYISPKDELLNMNFTKAFNNFRELSQGVVVNKPGEYRFLSSEYRFCPCKIAGNDRIFIELVSPPSTEISAMPIIDKCVGMTGYEFDFEFQGKPPFQVEYHVYQNRTNGVLRPVHNERGLISRSLKTFDKNYKFVYNPPAQGNYVIVFNSLKDMNYHKSPIFLDEAKHTYSTYFNQRSKFSFFETTKSLKKEIKMCYGEPANIPIHFKGDAPYSFNYDLINTATNEKLIDTVVVKNVSSYEIRTPQLTKGGTYEVKVSNILDCHSCGVDFDHRESVIIHSRSGIPEISLDSKVKEVKIVEGDSFEIPLLMKSTIATPSNLEIGYSVTNPNNSTDIKYRILRNSLSLKVKDEGIYTLTSFKDGGCVGKITNQDRSIKVLYHDRPNLKVISGQTVRQHEEETFTHLMPICQFGSNQIKLRLSGVKPFIIEYEIKLPNGKLESRSMSVNNEEVTANLPTNEYGRYEHFFKGVYDKLYTKEKSLKLSRKTYAALTYDVHVSPSAKFDKSNKMIQVCETNLKKQEKELKIPINLNGRFPFRMNMTLVDELGNKSKSFVLDSVHNNELNLGNLIEDLAVGEYILSVDEISDGNGCINNKLTSDDFVISITPVPDISKTLEKSHYCVGDHVSYNMSGIAPFTVYYNFNEKLQKAESAYRFQRLASKPGKLSIMGLLDSSANQCLANFTESPEKTKDLTLEIHDLPSVEINQGDYLVHDIHEGDQSEITFSFTGVPPFRLTYIRTIDDQINKRKNQKDRTKIVDTVTVEDIWDFEYTVTVGLEGTYEAIEIQDAYCTAKRHI